MTLFSPPIPSPVQYEVELYDVAILLINVLDGARDKLVGFEDAHRTLEDMMASLSSKVRVRQDVLESALWSGNMRNEVKKWWHPKGYTFDVFTRKVLRGKKFNFDYNFIEDK